MKSYFSFVRENFKSFGYDVLSVPKMFLKAMWQISGCLFILAFIFMSPVFIPIYAFIQYREEKKYYRDGYWKAKNYYNYFCDRHFGS